MIYVNFLFHAAKENPAINSSWNEVMMSMSLRQWHHQCHCQWLTDDVNDTADDVTDIISVISVTVYVTGSKMMSLKQWQLMMSLWNKCHQQST